jgi:hypothetical protein
MLTLNIPTAHILRCFTLILDIPRLKFTYNQTIGPIAKRLVTTPASGMIYHSKPGVQAVLLPAKFPSLIASQTDEIRIFRDKTAVAPEREIVSTDGCHQRMQNCSILEPFPDSYRPQFLRFVLCLMAIRGR